MKLISKIRGYRLYGAYILLFTVPLRGDCLTLRAVFDALFPSTPFKHLLIHSMQLHGVLDSVQKQSDPQEKNHLYQVMIQRVAQLEQSVDAVCVERVRFRLQDLEYLLIVLDKVIIRTREALRDLPPHDSICVQRVVALQEKIDRLL